jgi:hypothetical protein
MYNFNIVWNTAIPTIQVWRKRRYAIIGVGGITSSTISSSTTLTANTYIITIKAMRTVPILTPGMLTLISFMNRTLNHLKIIYRIHHCR